MFSNILGDKNVFKSMTAWGVFLYEIGGSIVEAAANAGFLTPGGEETLAALVASAGVILGALGIRKAVGPGKSA